MLAATLLLAASPAMAEPAAMLVTGSLPTPGPMPETRERSTSTGGGHLLVLGFGGDVGFSGDDDVPSPDGAVKHGAVIAWPRLGAGLTPLLSGADANFANLETVISRSPALTPVEKQYSFRGDPEGLRQAVAMGLTVFTAANNHAGDFGAAGILETLAYLSDARSEGLRAFAGLGIGPARYRPDMFPLGGVSVGVGAIGLGINHAGPAGPGQPLYASPQDFDRVLAELAGTGADVRVLSAHYGKELVSFPGERDEARFRKAVDSGAAQIVFGHHAHVPSAVEVRGNGVIFYGLGNLMHTGTQDMSRYGACRDFGLYARAYFWVQAGRAPHLRAVELVPLRNMHMVPGAMPPPDAARRIGIVNALNAEVTGSPAVPLRFEPTSLGSGLACLGSQLGYDDELAARCEAVAGPRQVSRLTDPGLLASCGTQPPPPPPQAPLAVAAEQPPPLPVAKPTVRRGNTSAAAAAEKPKQKGNFLQKLFD